MTKLLAEKLNPYKVGVYCQHPGFVRRGLDDTNGWMTRMNCKLLGRSPGEGRKTLTYLAETPNGQPENGGYFV